MRPADLPDRAARAVERRLRRLREPLAQTLRPTVQRDLVLVSPAGHRLPARLHTPLGPPPWPGVLLLPGGLDDLRSLQGSGALLSAQRLARAGLATLVFSPSGRGEAPGEGDQNGPLHQAECAAALGLLIGMTEISSVAVVSLSFGLVMAAGALVSEPALAARVRVFMDWEGPPNRTRPQYRVDLEAPEVQRPRPKTRSEDMTPEHRRWTKRDKARRKPRVAVA